MGLRRTIRKWRKRHFPKGLDADPSSTRRYMIGRSQITVGPFSYGLDHVKVEQWNEGASLTIGSFCSFASGSTIFLGGNHRTDWVSTFPFGHVHRDHLPVERAQGHPQTRGDILIGNDVWIGRDTMIMSGVTIGDGAVISAGAVITRDVAPYSITSGNPGETRRTRFPNEVVEELLALQWWHWPIAAITEAAPLLTSTPDHESMAKLKEIAQRYAT